MFSEQVFVRTPLEGCFGKTALFSKLWLVVVCTRKFTELVYKMNKIREEKAKTNKIFKMITHLKSNHFALFKHSLFFKHITSWKPLPIVAKKFSLKKVSSIKREVHHTTAYSQPLFLHVYTVENIIVILVYVKAFPEEFNLFWIWLCWISLFYWIFNFFYSIWHNSYFSHYMLHLY